MALGMFMFVKFMWCSRFFLDFVLWLIVVCEWLGVDLSAMGCCCLCLVLLLRFVWMCVWCISSQVCIVAVLSVCNSDEPSVCCVCGYI